jgi:hypothetical protein
VIRLRDSINAALKASLVMLVVITDISITMLAVQVYTYRNPAFPDADGDGFVDTAEIGWWTNWLDRNDSPVTTRIMPLAIAAIVVTAMLILGRFHRRRRLPDLLPFLEERARAMGDAVRSCDHQRIEACKVDFDNTIAETRDGPFREVLKEPSVQDIIVEFEMLCLDAFLDEGRKRVASGHLEVPGANRE